MTDPNNDLEQVASPSGHTSETELDRDVSDHIKDYNYQIDEKFECHDKNKNRGKLLSKHLGLLKYYYSEK